MIIGGSDGGSVVRRVGHAQPSLGLRPVQPQCSGARCLRRSKISVTTSGFVRAGRRMTRDGMGVGATPSVDSGFIVGEVSAGSDHIMEKCTIFQGADPRSGWGLALDAFGQSRVWCRS